MKKIIFGAVFPALAGINRRPRRTPPDTGRVPRASGDKPRSSYFVNAAEGVFPALAGINRTLGECIIERRGVPRASGDKPDTPASLGTERLCSPR